MKCFHLFCVILISFCMFACSAKRLPDYTPQPINHYNHNTQNGLTVAIYPMTQKTEIKEYFGTDISEYGILPVFVLAQNQNSEKNFIIQKKEIELLDVEKAQNTSENVGDRSGESEAIGVAGAVLLSPALIIIDVMLESQAAEIKRNFRTKEFQQAVISPGSTTSGFVYFQLPKTYENQNQRQFQIQVKAMEIKSKTFLRYSHIFDWKRR